MPQKIGHWTDAPLPAAVYDLSIMISRLRHLLTGPPLPTARVSAEQLNKIRALAAFSPDALSSIAYANQEIYLGLVVAGTAGLSLSFPVGLVITALLVIVTLSYHQLIQGYPSGGGSYTVARENLGTLPGLVAAAALLIDYLLVAAVSLTAGVAALASAFPFLWPHRVGLSLLLLAIIALANLRGLREAGTLMSIPVYLFLFTYLPMLAFGLVRLILEGERSLSAAAPPVTEPLTLFLILHAFSAGCTALTGIEAISNGVSAFHAPQARNARRTLLVMAFLMGVLFVGSIGLTQAFAVTAGSQETILSALARRVLGDGPAYIAIQISTTLILVVATNTSFAGFPRLAAILATDRFLPRQLSSLGERLAFSNGIVLLTAGAAALVLLFDGDTHALVPLFAVGVFLAYTLSQVGMVIHWWRDRGPRWWLKAAINSLGALATAVATFVIAASKFLEGAWLTLIIITLLVIAFLKIRAHYAEVATELSLRGLPPRLRAEKRPRALVPISGMHRGTVEAIAFARSISDNVTAVYVELEPGAGTTLLSDWKRWFPDIPLVILPSPYRSLIAPLLAYLDETDRAHNDGQLATVVLPEFVPVRWWHALLHNQTAWLIKAAILYHRPHRGLRRRVVIDVPFYLRH